MPTFDAHSQDDTSAIDVIQEIIDMVDGWEAKLTPDQESRLREAADELYSVASAIDQENWERYGHGLKPSE